MQLGDLLLVMLVEEYIKISDEMIAFLPGFLGGNAFAPLLPCKHRLTDMYPSVVYDVGFHYAVTVGSHNAGKTVPQQVVTHMP